jgi:hypothetical protein
VCLNKQKHAYSAKRHARPLIGAIGDKKQSICMSRSHSANVRANAKKREMAQYMADMLLEMRNMSRTAGFPTLTSLFELAFCEAYSIANHVEPPEGELEKIAKLSRASKSA